MCPYGWQTPCGSFQERVAEAPSEGIIWQGNARLGASFALQVLLDLIVLTDT